jgi:hypothetical protein
MAKPAATVSREEIKHIIALRLTESGEKER